MIPNPSFAAQLISSSATGYAALSAARLVERNPTVAERFGPDAFNGWKENLTICMNELATAVSEDRPRLFAQRVRWSSAAFTSRDVPVEDLRASLECMREILLEELPPAAKNGLGEYFDLALAALDQEAEPQQSELSEDDEHGKLALSYLGHLLNGERNEAAAVVLREVTAGSLAPVDAMLRVIKPALREVGRLWHRNEITIAEEHFATASSKDLISRIASLSERQESNGKTVVVGAVTGDAHDIGVQIVSDLLELDGWRVVNLGANTPPDDLAQIVSQTGADVLIVSATLGLQRAAAATTIAAVRKAVKEPLPVIVGGPAFDEEDDLWKGVKADRYCPSINDVVPLARELAGLAG